MRRESGAGALRLDRPPGIAANDVTLAQAAALAQAMTRPGEDLSEVTPAQHVEVIQADAAAFPPADEEQAEALALEVTQQQPGPAVPLEDAEDADATQLGPFAADGDVQHVVAVALARGVLQRLRVTDVEGVEVTAVNTAGVSMLLDDGEVIELVSGRIWPGA